MSEEEIPGWQNSEGWETEQSKWHDHLAYLNDDFLSLTEDLNAIIAAFESGERPDTDTPLFLLDNITETVVPLAGLTEDVESLQRTQPAE